MVKILAVAMIWLVSIGVSYGAGYTFVELDADAVGGKASGEVFKTARKNRYICDKNECQARGNYLRIKKYRESNKDKIRARDVISKKINREESLHRKYCIVCGCNQCEAHHHDYKKPSDVNFLCKTHHNELHSWDSN